MFDNESPGSCVPLLVFQLLAAPLGNAISGFTIALAAQAVVTGPTAGDVIGYPIYCSVGFGLGYAVQSRLPRSIKCGGTWVWIIPSLVLAWAFIDTPARFSWREAALLFWPGSEGEAAWGLIFLTLPTLACFFYSLGVLVANRVQRQRA